MGVILPCQIIYLNGPSSSGKTSLGKALQKILPEPFLLIGIDKIIGWMPEHLNDWKGGAAPEGFSWKPRLDPHGVKTHEIIAGPYAKKVVKAFHEVVLSLANKGYKIILDDVSTREQVDEWRKLLASYNVLWVGVSASLDVLEKRESQRDRIQGSARAQYHALEGKINYDIKVDTSFLPIEECAQIILENMIKL